VVVDVDLPVDVAPLVVDVVGPPVVVVVLVDTFGLVVVEGPSVDVVVFVVMVGLVVVVLLPFAMPADVVFTTADGPVVVDELMDTFAVELSLSDGFSIASAVTFAVAFGVELESVEFEFVTFGSFPEALELLLPLATSGVTFAVAFGVEPESVEFEFVTFGSFPETLELLLPLAT